MSHYVTLCQAGIFREPSSPIILPFHLLRLTPNVRILGPVMPGPHNFSNPLTGENNSTCSFCLIPGPTDSCCPANDVDEVDATVDVRSSVNVAKLKYRHPRLGNIFATAFVHSVATDHNGSKTALWVSCYQIDLPVGESCLLAMLDGTEIVATCIYQESLSDIIVMRSAMVPQPDNPRLPLFRSDPNANEDVLIMGFPVFHHAMTPAACAPVPNDGVAVSRIETLLEAAIFPSTVAHEIASCSDFNNHPDAAQVRIAHRFMLLSSKYDLGLSGSPVVSARDGMIIGMLCIPNQIADTVNWALCIPFIEDAVASCVRNSLF